MFYDDEQKCVVVSKAAVAGAAASSTTDLKARAVSRTFPGGEKGRRGAIWCLIHQLIFACTLVSAKDLDFDRCLDLTFEILLSFKGMNHASCDRTSNSSSRTSSTRTSFSPLTTRFDHEMRRLSIWESERMMFDEWTFPLLPVLHYVRIREVEGHAVRVPRRDRRLPSQDPAQVSQLQRGRHGGGAAGQTVAGRAHRPGMANHTSHQPIIKTFHDISFSKRMVEGKV